MIRLPGQARRDRLMRDRWGDGQVATDTYRRVVGAHVQTGMRILHAGCGWDRNHITRPHRGNCHVVGIDSDARVADSFHSEFYLCALEELPFQNASFDLVVSEYVWEHLDDPDSAFREIARTLKPGGCLIILTPSKWSYKGLAAWLLPFSFHVRMGNIRYGRGHEKDMYPTRYRCNTVAAFRQFGRRHGMSLRSVEYITNGPTWFARFPVLFDVFHGYHLVIKRISFLRFLRCALLVTLMR
jgi:SAM-dependent methyltransferase